jgi:hypothetical protein
MRGLPRSLALLLLLLFPTPAALAAKWKSGRVIEPGPAVLSETERALVADPTTGVEDAVILVEETEVNEDLDGDVETLFHCRAKILSPDGRDLANVELPLGEAKLKRWWGRVLCPDGAVRELPQSQVEQQVLARVGSTKLSTFKAALPGADVGCIVDYGWMLRGQLVLSERRIPLQRRWPIREFFYGWRPYSMLQGAYHMRRTESLHVDARVHNQGIVVSGGGFEPLIEEPWMPPDPQVRATMVLYYVPPQTDYGRFWDDLARGFDRGIEAKKSSIDRALHDLALRAGSNVDESVRKLYGWVDKNLRREELQSFEELQTPQADEKGSRDLIQQLMLERHGNGVEIHLFFVALARALGAQAHLVLAADRRNNIWNPTLRSLGQFDGTLVAVGPIEGNPVVVDPGSGLPYGGVPWWLSGSDALMVTPRGAKIIHVRPPKAAESVRDAQVDVKFTDDGAVQSSWTASGSGQVGLDLKRFLRALAPDERTDRLHDLCGSSAENEVQAAELVGATDPASPFALHCQSERLDAGLDESIDRYLFEWGGPWIESFPNLPDAPRHHAVVFDFPHVEIARVAVTAPSEFAPGTPLPPIEMVRPFGKYARHVRATETGFEVERMFALSEIAMPAEQYTALRDFLLQVEREDRAPLVFVRKP